MAVHDVIGGLTVDGDEVAFAGRRAKLRDAVERAFDRSGADPAVQAELGRALGWTLEKKQWVRTGVPLTRWLPGEGWAALLAADADLAADLASAADLDGDAAAKRVGSAILAAVTRLARPLDDAGVVAVCALVGEVARARCAALVSKRPKRGASAQEADSHARRLALLAEPATAEVATATMTVEPARAAQPGRGKRPAESTQPAVTQQIDGVRLRGGLLGPRGVVVRPVGRSALAWAAVTWRMHVAAVVEPPRPSAKSASPTEREAPMVVLFDGAPVAATLEGDGAWARHAAERAERGELAPMAAEQVAAFMARAAESVRLPGEQKYLAEIADGDLVDDVDDRMEDGMRRLAKALSKAPAHDPQLGEVRREAKRELERLRSRASELDRRSVWGRVLALTARREVEAAADGRESAVVDAWLDAPPPACAAFLAPGVALPSDAWQAWVVQSAMRDELDALDFRLSRPAPEARAAEIRARLLSSRETLKPKIMVAVGVERDRQAGVDAQLRGLRADALTAAHEAQAALGPGECAVAACDDNGWRVVRGTLPTLLAAGLHDLTLRDGVPVGSWSPDADLRSEVLTPEATAWAVKAWLAAGCGGEPPSMADAVRAVREALAAPAPKRKGRK